MLPSSKNISTEFEPTGFGSDGLSQKSIARISLVYDVLNLVINFPIEQKVREESREANLKYTKTINKTNAFFLIRESMLGVFIKKKIKSFLKILVEILTKTTETIRPNRSYPRNHKQKKPKSMNYKIM